MREEVNGVRILISDSILLRGPLGHSPLKSKLGFAEPLLKSYPPAALYQREGEEEQLWRGGPPPMVKYACKDNLNKLGYPAANVLTF